MLKFEVAANEVPEQYKDLYAEDAETKVFRLKVDGVVPKTKLDSFRDENIALKKQIETLSDVSQVADAKNGAKVQETIENLVQTRTKKVVEELNTKVTAAEARAAAKQARLEALLITDAARSAAGSEVEDSAVDDLIVRVAKFFIVDEDGKVGPKDGAVDSTGAAYTVKSYIDELKTKAPHLFKKSQGIGGFNRSRGQSPMAPQKTQEARLAGFATKKR